MPKSQPFTTIVTKDYPDDQDSRLDRPDTFRLNIFAGTAEFRRRLGHEPKEPAAAGVDPSTPDVLLPHPVYGTLGWLAIVNPGPQPSSL